MNSPGAESPYAILGVERTATEAEIKRAYFDRVREHPPERDPEGFKRVRAAYERLRAAGERGETDLFLIDEPSATASPSALRRQGPPLRGGAPPPPSMTPEMIARDLLALEAFLLLEELKA